MMDVLFVVQACSHASFAMTSHYPFTKTSFKKLYCVWRALDTVAHMHGVQLNGIDVGTRVLHVLFFVLHLIKNNTTKHKSDLRALGVYLRYIEAILYVNSAVRSLSMEVLVQGVKMYAQMRLMDVVW